MKRKQSAEHGDLASRCRQIAGLVEERWYLGQHPEVAATGMDPVEHYLRHGAAEGHDPHPLFHSAWYRQQYGEFESTPLEHYVNAGAKAGANPNPLFDSAWYLKTNPDVAAGGVDPLEHYWSAGAAEGRDPHPLFSSTWYRAQYPEAATANPLAHYLRWGAKHGLSPHPLFDPVWYLSAYPDAAQSGVDPFTHFRNVGGSEGRNPHPLFDSAFYLSRNGGVAEAGMNPLEHYLRAGAAERRDPHPLFSTSWYLDRYPDLAESKTNPLVHYVTGGAKERRAPHPLFDPEYYLSQQPGNPASAEAPLQHYLTVGWRRGLRPHPSFDPAFYLRTYAEVRAAGIEPLTHFVTQGQAEGRAGCEGAEAARAASTAGQPVSSSHLVYPEPPIAAEITFEPLPSTAKVVISVLFYHREDLIPAFLGKLLPQIAIAAGDPTFEVQLQLSFNYRPTASVRAEVDELVRVASDREDFAVEVVEHGFNLGFGAGHNAAFRRAASDVFIVLNSDLRVADDHWISRVVARFRSSDTAIVGATANAARLREDACGIPAGSPAEADYLDGSLLAVRSEAARRFGLFSEALAPFYFEDPDLCLRYRQAGLRLDQVDLPLDHERSSSARLLSRETIRGVLDRNREVFFARWGHYLQTRQLPNRIGVRFSRADRQIQCASLPVLLALLSDHPTAVLDLQGVHEQVAPVFAHPRIRLIPAWQTLRQSDYARYYEIDAERSGAESLVVELADRVGAQADLETAQRHLESLAAMNGEAKGQPRSTAFVFVPRAQPLFDGRQPSPASLAAVSAVLSQRNFDVRFYTDLGTFEVEEFPSLRSSGCTHIALASGAEVLRAIASAELVVSADSWISTLAQLLGKKTFVWLGAIAAASSLINLRHAGFFADRQLPCLGCYHRFGGDEWNVCLRGDVACMAPELDNDFAASLGAFLDGQPVSAAAIEESRVRDKRRSSSQMSLDAWPRSHASSVLVLIAANPRQEKSVVDRARHLAQSAIEGLRGSRVVIDDQGEAPPRGKSHPHRLGPLAAIRQGMVDRNLRDERWVLWMDLDICAYPPDLIEQLIARVEGGVAAPLVIMEGDASEPRNTHGFGPGRFYDVAGFVENGRWARFNEPFFDQPGPVYQLDSVGSCYLVTADLYRRGAKHRLDTPSQRFIAENREWNAEVIARSQAGVAEAFTEHYSICEFARQAGLPVQAFAELIAYHEKPGQPSSS